MRQIASSRLGSLLRASVPPRPAVIPFLGGREGLGDPGPSTFRSFSSSARQDAGGLRPLTSNQKAAKLRVARRQQKVAKGKGGPTSSFGIKSEGEDKTKSRNAPGRSTSSFDTRPQVSRTSRPFGSRLDQGPVRSGPSSERHNRAGQAFENRPPMGRAPPTQRVSTRASTFDPSTNRHINDKRQNQNHKSPFSSPAYTTHPGSRNDKKLQRPIDHEGDAFTTSQRITEWVNSRSKPMEQHEVDHLLRMVMDAPRYRVNTVVWNQVISILAREKGLSAMWRAFNLMKKRAYQPSSRTYTIMLNAYAGARHSNEEVAFTPGEKPKEQIWQQILSVYNESQSNIVSCIERVKQAKAKNGDSETGLTIQNQSVTMTTSDGSAGELREQINPIPTNAYMKILLRYGMWDQLEKVHLAMDAEGPLSPNTRTYQTLFSALLHQRAQRNEKRYANVRDDSMKKMTPDEFSSSVRSLWDEMVRRFHPVDAPAGRRQDPERALDGELAITVIRCLMTSRPVDQRLAVRLIAYLWNLPTLVTATPASMSARVQPSVAARDELPPSMRNLPTLNMTPTIAATVLQLLNRANETITASTWAKHLFSDRAEVRQKMQFDTVRSVIYSAGEAGDHQLIAEIMETFQPPTGKEGWQPYAWEMALLACHKKKDFTKALEFFRKMTHLAYGTEDGEPEEQRRRYVWHRPRGAERDMKGNLFHRPDPQKPTAKVMALLIRTSFGSNVKEVRDQDFRKAYNIFCSFSSDELFSINDYEFKQGEKINLLVDDPKLWEGRVNSTLVFAADWRLKLAKDVSKLADRLIVSSKGIERETLIAVRDKMEEVLNKWVPVLNPDTLGKEEDLRGKNVRLQDHVHLRRPLLTEPGQGKLSALQSILPVRSGKSVQDPALRSDNKEASSPAMGGGRRKPALRMKARQPQQVEEAEDEDYDPENDPFEGVAEEDILRAASEEERAWKDRRR